MRLTNVAFLGLALVIPAIAAAPKKVPLSSNITPNITHNDSRDQFYAA